MSQKKVKARAKLYKQKDGSWEIQLNQRKAVVNQCKMRFAESPKNEGCSELFLNIEINADNPKTLPQLGYIHAAIVPTALKGFAELGWNGMTVYTTYCELKNMFYYESAVDANGGEVRQYGKSMADATKYEASKFIEDCIEFIQNELHQDVLTPEEYYDSLGMKVPFERAENFCENYSDMQKYIEVYMKHFGYTKGDRMMCEVAWWESLNGEQNIDELADVHHIDGRGIGKDVPENLMGVSRANHERCHGTREPKISKGEQKRIHKAFMKNRPTYEPA